MLATQLLLLLSTFSANLSAESAAAHGKIGDLFDTASRAIRVNLPSRRSTLPNLTEKRLPPLTSRESKTETDGLLVQAGVHRKLDSDWNYAARWDITPEGNHVWRVKIQSPEASGIRFHLRGFRVGSGKLWLHDGSGSESEMMGPYTGDGPFADGEFWTDYVLSDTAVLEFEPASAPRSMIDPPPFEVVEISHLFPSAPVAGKARETAANCHLDVTCYPDWAFTARSVGQISFEKNGGSFVCSGTLLATQRLSGIPYFLTANHCVGDDTVARTMQVFWMYQSAACNGPAPGNKLNLQRSLGARYLAGGGLARGDFALVRLNSVPDTAVFSGWDTTEPAFGTRVTGIHHPDGDYKRIAFGQRVATAPGTLAGTDPDYYYFINLSEGRTQGGSSGSGLFTRSAVLVGTLTWTPHLEGPNDACRFQPEATGYGRLSTAYPALRQYLEGPANNPSPNEPAPNIDVVELTSGRGVVIAMPATPNPTLYGGWTIRVPQGATALRINLQVTGEVGLAASFGSSPRIVDGRPAADHMSSGKTGRETLVIDMSSTPVLRAGLYYIGATKYAVNEAVTGVLTATVETGGQTPNPNTGSRLLTSGVPANFQFAPVQATTVMNGQNGFRVQVPQGATRLELRLATATPDADIDLYARFGSDIGLQNADIVADHIADSPSGSETIVITPQSTPALRAGVYYIGLGIYTHNIPTAGTVTAIVTGGGNSGGNALTSGVPRQFNVAAVNQQTLLSGARGFTIQVPQGATRLDIRLATNPSNVDVDVYARHGTDIGVNNGDLVLDHDSSGPDGNELITITPQSTPPLKAGTYYIGFGLFPGYTAATVTVTATVTGGGGNAPTSNALRSGAPATFNYRAVDGPTLHNGGTGFYIDVPAGASTLDVVLNTATPGVDLDLFVRQGQDIGVQDGNVVADFVSDGPSGRERIAIHDRGNPPLRAGRYYIGIVILTPDVPVTGTITATIDDIFNRKSGVTVRDEQTNDSGGGLKKQAPSVVDSVDPAARWDAPAQEASSPIRLKKTASRVF